MSFWRRRFYMRRFFQPRAELQRVIAGFALLLAIILTQGSLPAGAQSAQLKTHTLDGFSMGVPEDWSVKLRAPGTDLNGRSPYGKQILMAWWWFPDEPLLGYPDIVSHKKVTVAGQPALYIRTFVGSRESLSITLDRPRKDRKRLRILYDVEGRLTPADIALFDQVLASVNLGAKSQASIAPASGGAPSPASAAPAAKAASSATSKSAVVAERRPLPTGKIASSRHWLGPVSFEAPEQWILSREADERLVSMRRPDSKAEIMVVLWPMARPMPNQGIEQMDFVTVGGSPAQRLRIRDGHYTIDHLFFDEPFGDGSRLSLLYRATGEPLEDGPPLFELVLASLDRTLAPPPGTWRKRASGAPDAAAPAGNVDTREFAK
jgi:hypothetical protein